MRGEVGGEGEVEVGVFPALGRVFFCRTSSSDQKGAVGHCVQHGGMHIPIA